MPSSWPRLCLSSSYEVIYFPKIPFLSTSQLVLFQLIGFIPRWDFLLLRSRIFWRSYCLLGNSRNNLKPFFSLNEIFIVQEMVEERILCLALRWTSFEIPIRKATSSQSIASSIDERHVAIPTTSLSHGYEFPYLFPDIQVHSLLLLSVTDLLKGILIHTHLFHPNIFHEVSFASLETQYSCLIQRIDKLGFAV